MKVPVYPQGDRDIIADGKFVGFANTTEDRDDIVQAINCHEKLVKALNKYGKHSTPEICCEASLTEGGKCTCGFEQALKEVEQK